MSDLGRDSSMEDILASIKRVIAEDAKLPGAPPRADVPDENEDVLELDQPMPLVAQEGPADAPLVSPDAADASRSSLAALASLRQTAGPAAPDAPLEAVIRDMLRPMLKQWLDERLPEIVEAVVAREVARITGRG